ncbi:MAG: hypothetical protein ABIJ97_06240 [Bacteroidota bacterium]
MKNLLAFCLIILIVISFNDIYCQETEIDHNEIIDLKTQLMESKLQMMGTKMELLERNLEEKIRKIDSVYLVIQDYEFQKPVENIQPIDTFPQKDYKYAISLNPIRLLEGSFLISCERKFSDKFSIDLSFMGTYVTKNGIGGNYLESQSDGYMVASLFDKPEYIYYNGEIIAGWGVFLEAKNYLSPNKKAPFGLYAAPQLMYRKVQFIGSTYNWESGETRDVVTNMDVIRAGVLLGTKIRFADVLCLDVSLGGVMRLSKYFRDSGFTKYQTWNNIDYSGVLPTINIKLGILK